MLQRFTRSHIKFISSGALQRAGSLTKRAINAAPVKLVIHGKNCLCHNNSFTYSVSQQFSTTLVGQEDKKIEDPAVAAAPPSAPEETVVGASTKFEFKTETHKLLDIVANSLYSDKEVFVRELISNAADASEKLRHRQLVDSDSVVDSNGSSPLEIHLILDKEKKTFTIQDFGIGLTEQELHENLGTIARSGSKKFVEQLQQSKSGESSAMAKDKIIGQFGVGFYSAFMVGKPIQVFTRSAAKDQSKGLCWTSDGQGSYEIAEAENVGVGTKIVIHLHDDAFINETKVKEVVKKYSNFVGFPIKLNGEIINDVDPLWTRGPGQISEDDHKKFYQSLTSNYDAPRYSLAYRTDAPISIRSILYIPETSGDMFGNESKSTGVTLYARNVMIQAQCKQLLPNWLRFVSGVVDSEDVPLNLSREILQNGRLISTLKRVLTGRIIKWLKDECKKDRVKFDQFYNSFHRYFKEAVILTENQSDSSDVIDLLRFSSSHGDVMVTFEEYVKRAKPEQTAIFYLCRPKSDMATNPYYEPFLKAGIEVLSLGDPVDKVAMNVITKYKEFELVDVESDKASELLNALTPSKDEAKDGEDEKKTKDDASVKLNEEQINELSSWILDEFGQKLAILKVKAAQRETSFPALLSGHHMQNDPYLREIYKQSLGPGQALPPIPANLEINPSHPIIIGLYKLKSSEPALAVSVCDQVVHSARLMAGVLDDARDLLPGLNKVLLSLVNQSVASTEIKEAEIKPKEE